MAMYRTGPTIPADIITYRYNHKLVYVRPADNYEQALDFAQKEFPDELENIPRDRITFVIVANMSGERKPVRISESAWPAAVARLLRAEVIDIVVRPDPNDIKEKEAPPMYLEVPQLDGSGKEKDSLRHSRSAPSSRTHSRSRSPTPSTHSQKSTKLFGFI
ncbi:hypothetical protein BDQ12DRAFT_673703 [Crucibulum laeve]|uniref:Uncharacterized protein n=1 Tax=Crucibulum laeve TaxID=68775 RepID=A0A5C3MI58_9AGAR|nr:hypothetical protein BDQ12DRAFT_673703 [Crucibulum laeve]